MKVALINPGRLKMYASGEPLNLGYIASYLEAGGHRVRIIDQLAGEKIEKEIEAFRPDVAGLTATTPLAEDAFRAAGFLRSRGILTVMGGVHASILPADTLARGVDIVVKGYGETAMAAILEEGITGGIIEGAPPASLDDIPKPARHLMPPGYFEKTKFIPNYLFVPSGRKCARMITSRGCAHKCIFCRNSTEQSRLLFHSPQRVLEEIEELIDKYDTTHIFFMDDIFLINRKRLEEICRLILSKGLPVRWACHATSKEIEEDLLPLIKEAGCRQINFGFESGSQKILDVLRKKTSVEENVSALRKAKEHGLITQGYFLVGSPGETVDDLQLTKKFIVDNLKYLDLVTVSFLAPFPGSRIYEEMRKKNEIPEPDKIDWSTIRYDTINFPVNREVSRDVLRKYYFELLSLAAPEFSTIFYRFLSDPVGGLKIFLNSDKRAVLRALSKAIGRQFRSFRRGENQ